MVAFCDSRRRLNYSSDADGKETRWHQNQTRLKNEKSGCMVMTFESIGYIVSRPLIDIGRIEDFLRATSIDVLGL
jgi:hypothetical protein